VASTARKEFSPSELGVPVAEERLSLARWQRKATVERVLDGLWTLPIEQVLVVVARIEQHLARAGTGMPVARRMTSAQVRQMHLAGVEIGAHSVRHPNLTLESPAVVREEMRSSRALLERLCDAPINGFAYPAGWKNADAEAAAAEAGFRYAVATTRGVNDRNALNLFSLARVGMPDTGVSDLKRALSTARQIPGPGSAAS
ncbi:MAG: polysaccharide deacetylase family protein, partial [Rhizobacter sp.]